MEELDKKHLMVNYLPSTLSQDDVNMLFSRIGPINKCKLIRNNTTGISMGYAFIEYPTEALAAKAITQFNGLQLEDKTLKISYARPASTETKNRNVYVASLPFSITENNVQDLFSPFGAIETLKLLTNADGSSRGVALVRYRKSSDALAAIDSMAGKTLHGSDSPLIVKLALPPKHNTITGSNAISTNMHSGVGAIARNSNVRFNPMTVNQNVNSNTAMHFNQNYNSNSSMPIATPIGTIHPATIYVHGLQPTHTELTLFELFSLFGGIINVKVVRDLTKDDTPCKGFGFVNYTKFEDASQAIMSMNNIQFEGKTLRVSFKQNKTSNAN